MFTMTNTVYENGQSGAQCRVRKKRPSVADVGFFEGAEKLLEVWFEFDASCPGLKLINRLVNSRPVIVGWQLLRFIVFMSVGMAMYHVVC